MVGPKRNNFGGFVDSPKLTNSYNAVSQPCVVVVVVFFWEAGTGAKTDRLIRPLCYLFVS